MAVRNTHPHSDAYHFGQDHDAFVKLASSIGGYSKLGKPSGTFIFNSGTLSGASVQQYLRSLVDLVTDLEVTRNGSWLADAVKFKTQVSQTPWVFTKRVVHTFIDTPSGNSSRIEAVIHDGTRWLIAAQTRTTANHAIVLYTTDPTGTGANNWLSTAEVFGATEIQPRGLAFGSGRYVVVGQNKWVGSATSLTASSWSPLQLSITGNYTLTRVAFGGGLWVITADGSPFTGSAPGKYATSPDGTTWTVRNSPISGAVLSGIAYDSGSGVWAMTGYSVNASPFHGYLATTTDPTGSWTIRWSGADNYLPTDIAFANGMWMAIGQQPSPSGTFTLSSTSPESSSWSLRDISTDVPISPRRVSFGDDYWVIVGFNTSPFNQNPRVYYVNDPANGTWQSTLSNVIGPGGGTNLLNDIAYAPKMWVVVGDYDVSGNGRGGLATSSRAFMSPTFDARIVVTSTAGLTANATISAAVSGSFTANSVVSAAASGSFTANAAIRTTSSGSLTANATIRATMSSSLTANATIVRTQAGSFSSSAFIAGHLSADATVRTSSAGSFTVDARVAQHFEADAAIRATVEGSANADAYVAAPGSGVFLADAAIAVTASGSVTVDATINRPAAGSLTANAVIKATASGSATANAAIRATQSGSFTASAVILRTSSSTVTANATIKKTQTGSFTGNAFVPGHVTADAAISAGGGTTFDGNVFDTDAFE